VRDVFCLHGTYGTRGTAPTPYGCTYVRALLPLAHPSLSGRVRLGHGETLPPGFEGTVLLERSWREGTTVAAAEALLEELSRRSLPLVHTLDDDLLDLHADEPWKGEPSDGTRRVVRLLAREARGVLVSTPPLGERMRRLNPRVEVVPNALDERLFFPPGREPGSLPGAPGTGPANGGITIGYMGTLTHEADLMSVLEPLRALLRRSSGRVRFELVGGSARPGFEGLFPGLPFRRLSPGSDHPYPRFAAWMLRSLRWDVALAPLVPSPFADAKSDLKYLDYAALGAAGVYADAPPYREAAADGETGLLARDPDGFARALSELVSDEPLRRRVRETAWQSVRRGRTLASRAGDWADALDRLVP
jgi:glycosyltransferase involved in cell wall biosynthesis